MPSDCGAGEASWGFLGPKVIKLVNLKGNQPWILIGRIDAEAETPVFWLSDANSQLIGKVPEAGKDWGQKEKCVRGWDGWMASLDVSLSELRELVMDREAWRAAIHGVTKSRTRLSDWTELNWIICEYMRACMRVSHSVMSDSCDPMDCSIPGLSVPHYLQSLPTFMSIASVIPFSHLIMLVSPSPLNHSQH